MGSCVSKRSIKKEEPYMPSLYMRSNECYQKNLEIDSVNLDKDVYSATVLAVKDYDELPDSRESHSREELYGESTNTSGYSRPVIERDKHAYDKPLAPPWPSAYAPSVPLREPPHNPDWLAEAKSSPPPEYKLTEKYVPFYINTSVLGDTVSETSIGYHSTYELRSPDSNFIVPAVHRKTDIIKNGEECGWNDNCVLEQNILKMNDKGVIIISNTRNEVFAPENSGVKVIFPRGCSPVVKYQVKCKIHTDFKPFTNHVSWMKDEWFIGPIPELTITNSDRLLDSPFWNHVCIMVPHCVEPEMLPYVRVHYSQPEHGKYGKIVQKLDQPETYVPKVKVDPDECFIVTESYVLIYTRHFTQFICTCTQKSRLCVEGFLFGSQQQIPGEQEVNLRLYLCKQVFQIKDFAQELISREKKLHVGRRLLERFSLRLPFNDVFPEDRLDVTLTSAEGISHWKPPSAPSAGQLGDHHLRQSVWFDELQPCDSCQGSQSSWSPIEVTRLLVHHCGNRPKQQFRGVSTVLVMKKGEAHPVTTTNMHFTMDLSGRSGGQGPFIEDQRDHLGYAFREIALTLKKDMIFPLARQLGVRDGQIEAIAYRFPEDLVEQKMQLLTTWLNKEGKSASVEKLLTILLKLKPAQRKLAEELYTFFFGQVDFPRPSYVNHGNRRLVQDRPLPDVPGEARGAITPAIPPRAPQAWSTGCAYEEPSTILSPQSSVRTQYGIPESEPGEGATGPIVEETEPKEMPTATTAGTTAAGIVEENFEVYAEPVYVFREPSSPVASRAESDELRPSDPASGSLCSTGDGGYPNLPFPSNTPIQAQSSLPSQLDPEPEELPEFINNTFHNEAEDVEDEESDPYEDDYEEQEQRENEENGEHELSIPDRPPNLDEVLDVRDIQEDGENDDDGESSEEENDMVEGNNDNNEMRRKSLEYIEVLILADLVLKDLMNTQKCCVHVKNDLDFRNASDFSKSLPEFPNLKSVVLHCGFRHSKKDINNKSLKKNIKESINKLDEKYPEATLYLSAVLPCRGNKNRAKIDEVNDAIEEICEESTAEYLDFSSELMDQETGKPDSTMYEDTVCLNPKGVKKISKILKTQIGIEYSKEILTQLGIRTREDKDDTDSKRVVEVLDTKPVGDVDVENVPLEKERSWFEISNHIEFSFSGL